MNSANDDSNTDDDDEAEDNEKNVTVTSHDCDCCDNCRNYNDDDDDDDDSNEDEYAREPNIRDLSWALRKLVMMKDRLRKTKRERLEQESRARSFEEALLRARGDNTESSFLLKTDPLLVYLRAENIKLERQRESLEDRVRDLVETLMDRDRCDGGNEREAINYLNERLLAVRHRCAMEKGCLRETITKLKLQSRVDTGDELSQNCLEQSMTKLAELTNNCDELRRDNERLIGEIDKLNTEIKKDTKKKEDETNDDIIYELTRRAEACECTTSRLRAQLADNDKTIDELRTELREERLSTCQLRREIERSRKASEGLREQLEKIRRSETESEDLRIKLRRESLSLRDESNVLTGRLVTMEKERDEARREREKIETELGERGEECCCLRREIEELRTRLGAVCVDRDRLERELGETRRCRDDETKDEIECLKAAQTAETKRLKDEFELSRDEVEKLKIEAKRTREDADKLNAEFIVKFNEVARLVEELGACRIEIRRIKVDKIDDKGGGDYVALDTEMKMQIEAVNRLRNLLNNSEPKAETAHRSAGNMLQLCGNGADEKLPIRPITRYELFETSRLLTEVIARADDEARKLLGVLKNNPPQQQQAGGDFTFDANNWLRSLTLTELATLHRRICLLTLELVHDSRIDTRTRIMTLRRVIAARQRQAEVKTRRLQWALMIGRARLLTIKERRAAIERGWIVADYSYP